MNRKFYEVFLAPDQIIWMPDTFFQNEKDGHYHDVDQENRFVRVSACVHSWWHTRLQLREDGYITYNRRLSLVMSCILQLVKYPMDTQECNIDFASCRPLVDISAHTYRRIHHRRHRICVAPKKRHRYAKVQRRRVAEF